jgi:hypothetical protein
MGEIDPTLPRFGTDFIATTLRLGLGSHCQRKGNDGCFIRTNSTDGQVRAYTVGQDISLDRDLELPNFGVYRLRDPYGPPAALLG